eukprot:TRINITY_DN542_c0_g1_i4.p1 TRINITY_DN542_c0_g1~~TRINITY_DN542_c0_g1_i4.p1  ORF type:complete len:195 (-),score=68.50 TRINITY_DN542_c0_g1_i4:25-609(-)
MAQHGPAYGFSAELEKKRQASYDLNLEQQARDWILALTGSSVGTGDAFAADLKDGSVLCNLINKIKPGSVKKINKGKLPFPLMENIGAFLEGCRQCGVQSADLFQTVDLFEAKNMNQVVHCLHALGRASQKVPGFNGPFIGVKEADSRRVEFTEEQLKASEAQLGLLQDGQRKAASSLVDRSADVNKNYQQTWK